MITKKKAAEMLKYWNLEGEDVTDVYFEGIGNRNENAYYVGSGYVLKCTANLGKLTTHGALSRAIADVGLQAASLVPTAEGREYVPDGEVYFYLTRRLDGKQIDPGELLAGNSGEKARFVGEIIGQLHLALSRVEGCVNDADLLETVKGWALPRAKEAMDLDSRFCGEFLEAFGELYPSLTPIRGTSSAPGKPGASSISSCPSGTPGSTIPATRPRRCFRRSSSRRTRRPSTAG